MSTLLLDLGNSRLKWAWYSHGELTGMASLRWQDWPGPLPQLRPHRAWLASVVDERAERVSALLQAQGATVLRARSCALLGQLRNGYREPHALGVDRFLALLGAQALWPTRDCLVVDAGTALTVDHLAADGRHLGGSISPGLGLMRSALAAGTDRLGAALAAAQAPESLPRADSAVTAAGTRAPAVFTATDTASAIEAGVIAAGAGAIAIQRGDPPLPVLLCGGDAARLAPLLQADTRLQPDLVLQGLARYVALDGPQG